MQNANIERYQQTRKATLIGAAANIVLAVMKVLFGWLGHSSALVADGVHSFSDLLTDLLVILAAKFASHEADEDHPYGHDRIETAATVALSLFLIIVGLVIIYEPIRGLAMHVKHVKPNAYVLWIAVFSVLVNEGIYRYTLHIAKKIKSDILHANALHSRSDAASSFIVLIGVGGSLLGWTWLDAVAAIIVGLMIVKMGVSIGWHNINELVDAGVDEKTLQQIKNYILNIPGVEEIHQLRTRKMAGQIMVDVHVIVPPKVSVSEGHHIGDQVLKALYDGVDNMRDVTVHVDAEDDELFSASASLPTRKELVPILEREWQMLPGVHAIENIHLHYQQGKLEIVVEIPLNAIDTKDLQNLPNLYFQAIKNLQYVMAVKILYSTT